MQLHYIQKQERGQLRGHFEINLLSLDEEEQEAEDEDAPSTSQTAKAIDENGIYPLMHLLPN